MIDHLRVVPLLLHKFIFSHDISIVPLLFMGAGGDPLEYNEELNQWKITEINGDATRNVFDVVPPLTISCNYYGKLKDGKPTGYGFLSITPASYSYVTTYRGGWKDGRYHGRGTLKTMFSSHSCEYSGYFKDGKKHGYGHESWLGGKYKGQYIDDEMCGEPSSW